MKTECGFCGGPGLPKPADHAIGIGPRAWQARPGTGTAATVPVC